MQYVRFVSSSQVPTTNTTSTARVVTGAAATKLISSSTPANSQKIMIQGRSVTVVQQAKHQIQSSKILSVTQATNKTLANIKTNQQGTLAKRVLPLESYIANNPGQAQKILAIVKNKNETTALGDLKNAKITTISQSQFAQLQQVSTGNKNNLVIQNTYSNSQNNSNIKKAEDSTESVSLDEEEIEGEDIENKDDNDGTFLDNN